MPSILCVFKENGVRLFLVNITKFYLRKILYLASLDTKRTLSLWGQAAYHPTLSLCKYLRVALALSPAGSLPEGACGAI